ncbi:MCP methyltransferase/methylesterase, CheR/CheB [Azoarcus sp. CIB]|nr:MCP methyltransferase/methylesterase, CheR/CheB [Azoarcus sp. CIB]
MIAATTGALPDLRADGLRPGDFSIVGMGASAGGLEAFEQFFRRMPADSGMAFVLVQHLDPDHASLLTEILQRATTMPVVEATDHLIVAPDRVHVIPPNRDMAIFHGTLQLSVPDQPRGLRMPIDAFLRSLAEDRGEKAVGIILSGTGTDGTQGLRAILGAGGISLVQDPAGARYDGMPASAIRAGYATAVLAADAMPHALLAGIRRTARRREDRLAPAAVGAMSRILMRLRTATGHDFSHYKKSTIGRRIERRMAQHDIEDIDVYARYVKENPAEIQTLFKELLINVTSFFRDAEAFVTLKREILPLLLRDKPEAYVLRIWVAGCATGEEAYSIAILLRELMDEREQAFTVQIYATDLDEDAISAARTGVYPPNIVQDVQPDRLHRFFLKDDAGYRVRKEIREMVVFAVQNVIKDPPFTRLDLLCCRNLMIYLEPELQNRLIPAFHYALKPGGILFLSPSESIGNHTGLFTAQDRKWKFYRATHSVASARTVLANGLSRAADRRGKAPEEVMKRAKETNFDELTRRVLLQSYAPASVLTDLKGNILYVHGDTGNFLRPAPGQATLNVVEMAREPLPPELRAAILHATSRGGGGATLGREVAVTTNGKVQTVSFSLRPVQDTDTGETVLVISFEEMSGAAPGTRKRSKRESTSLTNERIEALERELAYTRESLQATIEEQQASNEEMQSTNEELQSSNEELETSREELQSVNEELVTVNAELHAKIQQLTGMQNDMKNLLDNVNVGTIFLDEQLLIRRFTREAARVYRLIGSDVGRPLGDIKSELEGDDLLARAQTVLDSLIPYECELRTDRGAWYLARIMPYRTVDNVIEGVVLTFTDISRRVETEAAVQTARDLAEGIVDTVREPLLVLDGDLKIVSASRSFYRNFRVTPKDTLGRPLYDVGDGQWDIPKLRELLETILPRDRSFEDYVVEHVFPTIGRRRISLNARRIAGRSGDTQLILLAMQDDGQERGQ